MSTSIRCYACGGWRKHTKSKGTTVTAAAIALSDEQGFPHRGTVNFVDNQVDPQTGTLRYRASFPNTDRLLSPGLFVRVRILIGEPHPALVIPESALGSDQGRKFLYVIGAGDKAIYRPVTVGAALEGGKRVVLEGLSSGERFVVEGLQRVKPDAPVKPIAATATTPEPVSGAKQPSPRPKTP